jgi:pyridoxine/pyridoxamine 5'-phosphate oxidase
MVIPRPKHWVFLVVPVEVEFWQEQTVAYTTEFDTPDLSWKIERLSP